ncbi:MAG: hypothetical protein DRP18_01165 [Candidatus Aenigmatarchaeota archaeon]|nr:MAG: hypothetical protein DRP18_01165 [Candidatus Aenigmarchaeota archaeon]RLJ08941.1 MAG: hypothetical protein DRP16_00130 [Candidatus Aenigmarchaeota archaeon]
MNMFRYVMNPKPQKSVKVYGRALRISTKNSVKICREINGKPLKKAKRLLEDLITQKRSINGKYYTNISRTLLKLLESAEKNAEFKGLELEKMIVKASSHKGFTFWRPRRLKLRGTKRKMTNIQIFLEEK